MPDTEDGDLILGLRNFRRVSAFGVWLRLLATALCIILMATSVLFALIWVPRLIFRRLRGAAPPFSRASFCRRFQPLAAVLMLVLSIAFLAIGMADAIPRLGRPTFVSIGFAVCTSAFALLALVSAVQWWRTRGEGDVAVASASTPCWSTWPSC